MKTSVFLGGVVSLFLLAANASAAKIGYSGELDSGNEVTPPNLNGKNARGWVEAIFDDQTKRLCGRFIWEELTGKPNGIHVHQAPAGMPNADGTVKFIIPVPAAATADNGEVAFNILLDAAFANSLVAEEVYGNIHTDANTKGEIRSTLFRNDDILNEPALATCPPPTPVDAGAPASDSGTQPPPSGTSSGSPSNPDDTPSGNNDSDLSEPTNTAKPAAKEDSGCSTSGGSGDLLGFGLAAGVVAFVASRRRRS